MHIVMIAMGSRGDVQPYVALGKGLRAAGHRVRILSSQRYAGFVRSHGLDFHGLRGDPQEVAQSPEMQALLAEGNFLKISAYTAKAARQAAAWWAEDAPPGVQGADLLVAGIGGLFLGLALAEKHGLPLLQAYNIPFTPTGDFPGALFPQGMRLPRLLNRLTHHLTRQAMWQGSRVPDGELRRAWGLPAAPLTGPFRSPHLLAEPVLYGFSPQVIPRPADWDDGIHVTGFWSLQPEAGWQPPADLRDFLEAGPPPVYVGFGSMSARNPRETAALVLQALAESGQRAVLLSGWGGLAADDLPETVHLVESIPHAWLFPRMAAVVHHGGAGTTAAGLQAGVPSIIIPFFGDQPFWGARVAALGVGPRPIPRKKLTAAGLAGAIRQAVEDETMRARAAALGERIRAEDGVAQAVLLMGRARARASP